MKVDLGCNVFCNARVYAKCFLAVLMPSPDSSKIFVGIGYNFFVEYTLDEAIVFIKKKTAQLLE